MCEIPELPDTFVPGFHDESQVRKMPYTFLGNTGMRVSKLSLGTGGFSYFYGDYDVEECKKTVLQALKSGVNFIDTGPWYGHGVAEDILGKCLEGIPRQAYYLATKVGRYEKDPKLMFNFTAEKTRQSFELSLKRLGVRYIDLIQVHDIEFAPSLDIVLNETLPVLEELVKQRKALHIGITAYPVSTLVECIEKSRVKIETILSYCRLTMIDQTLKKYEQILQSRNIGIVNGAVHSMGLLSSRGSPDWHPAPPEMKDICAQARDYCKAHDVEIGKLAMYYAMQESMSHTILVGMNNRQLLEFNLDVVQNGLTKKELEANEYINKNFFSKLSVHEWEEINLAHWKKDALK